MLREEVPLDLVQQLAVKVDEFPAVFALEMEMLNAGGVCYILVAGAVILSMRVLSYATKTHQLLKLAVNGGLPDSRALIYEVSCNLADRNMAVS
jgi:hypothetical protein